MSEEQARALLDALTEDQKRTLSHFLEVLIAQRDSAPEGES